MIELVIVVKTEAVREENEAAVEPTPLTAPAEKKGKNKQAKKEKVPAATGKKTGRISFPLATEKLFPTKLPELLSALSAIGIHSRIELAKALMTRGLSQANRRYGQRTGG